MKTQLIICTILGALLLQIPSAVGQTKYKIVDNDEKVEKVINNENNETMLVIQDEVRFSISRSPSINTSQPALQNNSISLKNGVFGLAIDASTATMLDILGTPTSTYKANDDTVLYSYGRNLWVTTYRGLVKKITTENHWVSATLTNLIAFDNRFNSEWLIEDKVGYEHDRALLVEKLPKGTFLKNGRYRLSLSEDQSVHLDVVIDLKIFDGEKEWLVNGFEYGYTDTNLLDSSHVASENTSAYSDVIAFVDSKRTAGEEVSLDEINKQGYLPIFDAYADNGDVIQVYGNNLVLNFTYGDLSKLSVYEGVFRNKQQSADWKFGKHYTGQPSSEIKALYGDDVMGYDDYLQVFLDDAKYDLYLVENDSGAMTLVELEMEFF